MLGYALVGALIHRIFDRQALEEPGFVRPKCDEVLP